MEENSSGDLDTAEKLVKELSRIKTQNAILKKAFVQEQQKNQQLETNLKEKEIKLRAALEENDILTFNNTQLTKKVTALQTTIQEEKGKSSSGGWFSGGAKQELQKKKDEIDILTEELQKKIRENEELHHSITESKKVHDQTTTMLQQKMDKLKKDLQKQTEDFEDAKNQHKSTVEKLMENNNELNMKLDHLADSLVRTKQLMTEREHTMTKVQQKLTSDLESSREIIGRKIMFDDTKNSIFNQRNIPPFDANVDVQRVETIETGFRSLESIFKSFIDFHTAQAERLLIEIPDKPVSEEVKTLNKKSADIISGHKKYFDPVLNSFKLAVDKLRTKQFLNASENKAIIENFRTLVLSFQNLCTSEQKRFQENVKSEENEEQQRSSEALAATYKQLASNLDKLLQVLVNIFPTDENVVNRVKLLPVVKQFQSQLIAILNNLREMHAQYTIQVKAEQNDLFIMGDVKKINNTIISNLSRIVAQLDNFSTSITSLCELLVTPGHFLVRGVNVKYDQGQFEIADLQKRSSKFLQNINDIPERPSIPYEEQLQHIETIKELLEQNAKFKVTIESLNSEIQKLVQEKQKLIEDLSASRDSFNAKQSQLNELLAELADTRKKLQQSTTLYQEEMNKNKAKDQQIVDLKNNLISANTALSAAQSLNNTPRPANEQQNASEKQDHQASPDNGEEPSVLKTSGTINDGLIDFNTMDQQPAQKSEPTSPVVPQIQPDLISFMDFDTPSTANSPLSTTNTSMSSRHSSMIFDPFSNDLLTGSNVSSAQPSPQVPRQDMTVNNITNDQPTAEQALLDFFGNQQQTAPEPMNTLPRSNSDVPKQNGWSLTVMDEAGKQSNSLSLSEDDKKREEELKKYYEDKYNQYLSQLQIADKKAMDLFKKKQTLEEKLKQMMNERELKEKELDQLSAKQKHTQEDLDTTRTNYEGQLQMMSEHLIGLSDKIGKYEAELAYLKESKVRCGKCKTWNTIAVLITDGKNGQCCSKGNHPSSFNYA
eukprot:TRINITY_DN8178_c0_g1_i1.p1 TRINITY_DN8178_c0_g1~~TRINITY_DN8178_c0_g1_i1.p1  ORF type:complete len:1000 (+),score=270.50 TRINITY_DN8178_c0_g1_i1:144-3143(+)